MDLSIYDNSDFDRGASRWKEAVWILVRFLFFQNAFPWPSPLRCALLRIFGAKIGRGVVVRANVNISFPWRLTIGDHVWISEDVGLLTLAPVTVREGSWIAAASFIAPGIEIGSGATVSAGSVVFASVAPKTFVRGNPATVVSEFRGQRSEVTKTEGGGQ